MADEHFPIDLTAHAPAKQFVAQVHTVELVKALVALFAPNNINGGRNGVGKISHDNPRIYTHRGSSLDFAPS